MESSENYLDSKILLDYLLDMRRNSKSRLNIENHTIQTLGGRNEEGFQFEKNDCTVRAYSIATGMSYKEAYQKFKDFGRKPKKGVRFIDFIRSIHNDRAYVIYHTRTTPNRFVQEHPVGKFVCRIKKHVFAVVDGKIHDNGFIAPKKRIDYFVEIY